MSEAVTQSIRERIPTSEELGFDPGLLAGEIRRRAVQSGCAPRATANTGRSPVSSSTIMPILTLSRASRAPR